MSIPSEAPAPPPLVTRMAGGRVVECVWRNEIGGTTWQLGIGAGREFLKVGPAHPEFEPALEAAKLCWAAGWLRVPEVLGHGEQDGMRWLLTRGLPGTSAITRQDDPEATVRELGRALRRIHDALPVEECPWDWSAEARLSLLDESSRSAVGAAPSVRPGDLVVCHGDACNPNFLVGEDGRSTGCLDLGALGVADRHADLAPALLSLGWNFGGVGFDEGPDGYVETLLAGVFLEGYGLDVDPARIDWYTRLWNAG